MKERSQPQVKIVASFRCRLYCCEINVIITFLLDSRAVHCLRSVQTPGKIYNRIMKILTKSPLGKKNYEVMEPEGANLKRFF